MPILEIETRWAALYCKYYRNSLQQTKASRRPRTWPAQTATSETYFIYFIYNFSKTPQSDLNVNDNMAIKDKLTSCLQIINVIIFRPHLFVCHLQQSCGCCTSHVFAGRLATSWGIPNLPQEVPPESTKPTKTSEIKNPLELVKTRGAPMAWRIKQVKDDTLLPWYFVQVLAGCDLRTNLKLFKKRYCLLFRNFQHKPYCAT